MSFMETSFQFRTHLCRRPAILLANDHPSMTVRYRHVVDPLLPDQGKPLGQFDIPPHGRQWIETPLGVGTHPPLPYVPLIYSDHPRFNACQVSTSLSFRLEFSDSGGGAGLVAVFAPRPPSMPWG